VQTYEIAVNVKDFAEIRQMLKSEVDVLKSTLKNINTEKNALFRCVDRFDKLSEDLQGNLNETQQGFANEVNKISEDLYAEYEYLKFQTEKANVLKLFYDKQGDDGEDGLSRDEYEYLLYDLDESIRDRFPSFEEFDANNDGVIDIFEFDSKLDELYKDVFSEQKTSVQRQIGQHYVQKNSSNQDANSNQQERRKAKEREKRKMPLSMFKSFR